MKMPHKIVLGCVWVVGVLLFSIYCNRWFPDLANFVGKKIVHTDISPEISFLMNVIPWNCFISFLACLPVLLVKKRRAKAWEEISGIMFFFVFLLAFNLLGVLNWIVFFPESIGNHSSAPTFSTLEPYALNDGWTRLQFWCAWSVFIIVSNGLSIGMAFLALRSPKSKQPLLLS